MTALPAVSVRAADGPVPIRLEAAALPLTPKGAPTAALHLAGLGQGGAIRLGAGRTSELPFRNGTSEPVTPQWQGLRGVGDLGSDQGSLAAGSDGLLRVTPRDGGTALFRAAPAPTHPAGRGARSAVIVGEPEPAAVDRDLVLLLEDWLLAADHSLRFGSTPPAEAVSGVVTVNGTAGPTEVRVPPRARLRLRFVNASVQRLMLVSCLGARPMIAAIDGQPSELFAPARNTIPIGPGARYDLLLDMPGTEGSTVRFTLKPTAMVGGKPEVERDLLVLSTDGTPLPARPPMVPLPPNLRLPTEIRLEAAHRAELTFDGQPPTPTAPAAGWSVNGIPGSAAGKPVLTVRRGDAVVLALVNASAALVPLRIAGQAVRLLHGKDDGWEPYWRDTLLLPPRSRNHVAFVADIEGRWPIDSGFDDLTLAGLSCVVSVEPR